MAQQPIIIFGHHAVLAAIHNPKRKIKRAWVTLATQNEYPSLTGAALVENKKIESLLPLMSVHQGVAIEVEPLLQPSLDNWLAQEHNQPLVMLDQVTDPHNVGAILRSAAAFNAGAVIVTDRNAPAESGVMAKSASGGLEVVPLIHVVNLSQAIKECKKAGYWVAGLDGSARQTLVQAKLEQKTLLVLGAEGSGMRRLTAENCDFLVKLPMSGKMESLNVSNACAIALYELYRSAP